jgi:hypothetical protein
VIVPVNLPVREQACEGEGGAVPAVSLRSISPALEDCGFLGFNAGLLKEWKESDSPSIQVANIVIPPQNENPELDSICQSARFSPENSYMPDGALSSMGRDRSVLYGVDADARKANQSEITAAKLKSLLSQILRNLSLSRIPHDHVQVHIASSFADHSGSQGESHNHEVVGAISELGRIDRDRVSTLYRGDIQTDFCVMIVSGEWQPCDSK